MLGKILNQLKSEGFPSDVITVVMTMRGINGVFFVENIDEYTERLMIEFDFYFRDIDRDTFDQALKIWNVMYDWEARNSCHGIGECVKTTFKQLLKENQNGKDN